METHTKRKRKQIDEAKAAYDNRSVIIPWVCGRHALRHRKIAKITVNPITLRPKWFIKKNSITTKLQATPFWRISRHVKLVVPSSDCVRSSTSSNMNIHEFSRSSDFWGGASIGVATPTGHTACKKRHQSRLGYVRVRPIF